VVSGIGVRAEERVIYRARVDIDGQGNTAC